MPENLWPENEFKYEEIESPEIEEPVVSLLNVAASEDAIGTVIDITRFSSLTKLLKVTAFVQRFIERCRPGSRIHDDRSQLQPLSTIKIANAEISWVKYIQSKEFSAWFSGGRLAYKDKTLGAFIDQNGLIRCSGRMPTLYDESEHPKLLPRDHHFTILVINHCHRKLLHAGMRQTLAQIRYEYWIPQGKSQVQKVIKKCVICRKTEGGPFKVPESPPLPSFRVKPSQPFENVGIGYLGPLYVKVYPDDVKEVWVCLYTCAVIRAVHLEVVQDLTTEEFIMSLRRFSGLYGKPKLIVSDNGTQFKAANSVLQSIFQTNTVQDFSSSEGIEWKFIPEAAPWMGGFYERLVGSVKRCLKECLGKRCLSLIQLQTVVVEVSAIINSRPIVSSDPEVNEEALTPGHFLAKQGKIGLPSFKAEADATISPIGDRQGYLLDRWKKGQNLLNDFWQAWGNEYMMELRERPSCDFNPKKNVSEIKLQAGTVVLIKEDLPRCRWKLGKIVSLNISQDDQTRSVIIQLSGGKKIARPIKHLYPVENSASEESADSSHITKATGNSRYVRSIRSAAKKAASAIRQQLDDEEYDSS